MSEHLARRDLLLAAGGGLLAAAALPSIALAQADGDAAILRSAIELELLAAEAYDRASPQLGGIARLFRNQERQHAAELASLLRSMGGKPASAPVSGVAAVSRAGSRRAAAQELIKIEDRGIAAYVAAHGKLRDARAMQLMTTILGNQAQHLVALRDVLGSQKVPTAFEIGRG
jgi:rubrerythrin